MTEQTRDLQATTRFDPGPVESHWMAHWLDQHLFHAEPDPSRPPYSIVIPPPNVTGKLHMGHALNDSVQDALTRYHRMLGDNACWMLGTDHAGIATQNVVEKRLRARGPQQRRRGPRRVRQAASGPGASSTATPSSGSSSGWAAPATTSASASRSTSGYVRAVVKVFVALYAKGYIYKDHYIVNWCPRCGTAISDLEVAYVEEAGHLYHVRYALQGGGSHHHRHHAARDHAGRHRRRREPRRRALQRPRRAHRGAAAAGPRAADRRRRARRPRVRHRRAQDHAGPRPHRLRHRPRPRPRRPSRPSVPTAASPPQGGPYAGLDVDEARERVVADLRAAGVLEKVDDYTPQRGHLRPLRHPHRAAHLAAVVHAHGRAQGAGHRGRARRPRALRARALGPGLHRLDGEAAAVVHLAPALVGPSASGLVLREPRAAPRPSSPSRSRRPAPRAAARACAATPTCSTPGSARRCGPSPPGAGPTADRRPRVLLPDEPAQHGPRDHLPVGRAHGHDGPRVRGRRALPRGLHPLRDPGRRRAPHEQVAWATASTRSR